jgi:hypothetical protein
VIELVEGDDLSQRIARGAMPIDEALPIAKQEAIDHYTLGLNEDPLHLASRAERAVCLRAASRYAEGNDELRQILELDEACFSRTSCWAST